MLSKRPERFAPGIWPAYYSKAKGCEIWDLDNNHYYDFASMGIGTCTLGYSDDEINNAAFEAIAVGSMTTLNTINEVYLAEELLKINPWAEMVRYARTGGEACAVAVRIARAATGRTKVAFCGYHGWHDWYISANIMNGTNLNDQLLPNLTTAGVPNELAQTAYPFKYNDCNSLDYLFNEFGSEIACIIFEIQRGTAPTQEFLNKIQELGKKYNSVIICDEVTSGFRMNIGGVHMIYDFIPDMAVYGKTLANGIAMAAIIGKKNVMESAQDSFISSAYWTENVGPTAALATLAKMQRIDSPSLLNRYGNMIMVGLKKVANDTSVDIHFSGIPPLLHMDFEYESNCEIQTYFAQIMLKKGFLVGPSMYTTCAYTDDIIDMFVNASAEAFKEIKDALERKIVPLEGIARSDAFKRMVY